jgi:hypothetical protein
VDDLFIQILQDRQGVVQQGAVLALQAGQFLAGKDRQVPEFVISRNSIADRALPGADDRFRDQAGGNRTVGEEEISRPVDFYHAD